MIKGVSVVIRDSKYIGRDFLGRTLLLAALFVFATSTSAASTFYVKPVATGAANGSSWTDALGPDFNPVRNNIYYIADGNYPAKTWSTPNAGTNSITIKKALIGDHGTSVGWSDAFGDGEAVWGRWVVSTDFWIFDGQWRTDDSPNNWDGAISGIDYGFRVVGGGPSGKTLRLDSGGAGGDHCTFKYCDFVGGGSGTGNIDDVVYGLAASDSIMFSHCSLRDSDRTIFLLRGEWQNLLVENSFMGRNNSTPANHGELLSDVGSDYVTFRNNVIEDTEGTSAGFAILNGFGSKSSANTANGWKIYGNVFRSTANGGLSSSALIWVANDPPENENWMDNCTIANNTVVNMNLTWGYLIYHAKPGIGNVVINNVFYNNSAPPATAFVNAGALSQNWYYNTDSSGDSGTGKTICSTSCSAYFQNPSASDMRLTASLAGTALAPEFNTDMFGRARGTDGTWDRGAYEFVSGAADVTPPTVHITTPADSSVVRGSISLLANASDNVAVAGVQFFVNGQPVASEDSTSPYSILWDTTSVTDGSYILQARARDSAGNTGFSGQVTVTAQNGITNNLLNDLVGYWRFDEGTGTQVANSTGLSPVGSLQPGSTWTTGLIDQAVMFDGVSGHVVVPDSPSLRISGSISLAMWVRHTSVPSGSGLMYYLEKGNTDHDNFAIGIQSGVSGLQLFFEFEDTAGIFHHYKQSSTVSVNLNQWVHFSVVFDDSNNEARFYKDGVQAGTASISQSINGALSYPVYIGRENFAGFENSMAGSIDDLRVYSRSLTPSEVALLFGARPPAPPVGLRVTLE